MMGRSIFISDVLQRWMGHYLNNDAAAKNIWYELGVEDLWKYNSLVTFRPSYYSS
ncbi:hypothetical protein RhiirC2_737051, partial [Rhizophagus irregularis]